MASFTPGPWIYSGGYPAFVASPDKDEPGNALKAMVCNLDARLEKYQRPQDEVDANGFLIAAAPDLIEACKALLNIYDSSEGRGNYVTAVMQIANAVARAEGREDV